MTRRTAQFAGSEQDKPEPTAQSRTLPVDMMIPQDTDLNRPYAWDAARQAARPSHLEKMHLG